MKIDYLGPKVFTQMSVEENDGDPEAGKIFGDLHSLVCTAERIRLDALDQWTSESEIKKTKEFLDESVTGEILIIATALRVMGETTKEHADDLRADEAHLQAEDAERRSDDYKAAYAAILRIFS
ncbi:MAG TPA: hypothetical protein VHS96_09865 [Bacteroidia bacterium]|nr:hypothetical protein [Bacteroidia bacterium]